MDNDAWSRAAVRQDQINALTEDLTAGLGTGQSGAELRGLTRELEQLLDIQEAEFAADEAV